MQITKLGMKPLADNPTIPHYHCPNKRIGTDSTPATLRKLKSSPEMRPIVGFKRGSHD